MSSVICQQQQGAIIRMIYSRIKIYYPYALLLIVVLFCLFIFNNSQATEQGYSKPMVLVCMPKPVIITLYSYPGNSYYWEGRLSEDYFAIINEEVTNYRTQYLLGRIYDGNGRELKNTYLSPRDDKHHSLDRWYLVSKEWNCLFEYNNDRDLIIQEEEYEDIDEKFTFLHLYSRVSNESSPDYSKSIGCTTHTGDDPSRAFKEPNILSLDENMIYFGNSLNFMFERFHKTDKSLFMEGALFDSRGHPILRSIEMENQRYRLVNNWFILPEEWTCLIYQ